MFRELALGKLFPFIVQVYYHFRVDIFFVISVKFPENLESRTPFIDY